MVPKQGVLVYEVNNRVNVELLIAPALSKGEKYDNTEERLHVTVDEALAGGFAVRIQAAPRNEQVTVPSDIGADSRAARRAIHLTGLVARFSGPLTNSEVQSQSPEGGDVVQRGSTVRLKMAAGLSL